MKRETLQAEKRAAKRPDYHPSLQFTHAVIDSHLQALDLIDGGTTAANRTTEIRAALDDLRKEVAGGRGNPLQLDKALFMIDLISREMLSSDYRRYSTWADQQPRIEEEFGCPS